MIVAGFKENNRHNTREKKRTQCQLIIFQMDTVCHAGYQETTNAGKTMVWDSFGD
jgi:hypothetical protein